MKYLALGVLLACLLAISLLAWEHFRAIHSGKSNPWAIAVSLQRPRYGDGYNCMSLLASPLRIALGGLLASQAFIWNTMQPTEDCIIQFKSPPEPIPPQILDLAFTRDGRFLAIAPNADFIKIWDLLKHKLAIEFSTNGSDPSGLSYSRSNRQLVVVDSDGTISLFETRLYKKMWEFKDDIKNLYPDDSYGTRGASPAFSLDDHLIAYARETGRVYIRAAETGDIKQMVQGAHAFITCLSASPSSQLLAWGDASGIVHIAPWSNVSSIQSFQVSSSKVSSITFSPNGQTLLVGLGNGTVYWMGARHHTVLSELSAHKDYVIGVGFLDEKHIVTADSGGNAFIWARP